jgi:hypothetical protein
MATVKLIRLIIAAAACGFVALAGCRVQGGSSPPGAASMTSSGSDFNFTYLQWKDGLSIIFVDNLSGGHSSHGSGSTQSSVYVVDCSAGNESLGYKCHLESSDGKTASLKIDGTEYDLANGTLFVMKSRDGKIVVHQSKFDSSAIPFHVKSSREALAKNEDVQKLLVRGGKE